jgi:glutamine synthetase
LKNTPEALEVFNRPDVIALFEKQQVLRKEEIHARYEVEMENYILKRQIETHVLLQIARGSILPAAMDYQSEILVNVQGLQDVLGKESGNYTGAQLDLIKQAGDLIQQVHAESNQLQKASNALDSVVSVSEKARGYAEDVLPLMESLGDTCSKLELTVDDALWPLPKFTELLFTR